MAATSEQERDRLTAVLRSQAARDALHARIDRDFTYHRPKPGQPAIYEGIRAQARDLAETFVDEVPEGRELSLALTKLEEAVMWANAGIARSGADTG